MLCESFLVVHWSRLARPERPLSSTRISDWLTADRDERLAGVASRGQILINRKLIVRFVRLSVATIDVIRKRMNVGESLLAATAKKTAKRQAAECREGKKGRAVGRRWRTWKELEPWGLHCCSAGDYDWQANSFSFFFFCSKFTEWFRPVEMPSRSRVLLSPWPRVWLFKYRSFSYDLLDCVVKTEVVVAIACCLRHFFLSDVSPTHAPFLAV